MSNPEKKYYFDHPEVWEAINRDRFSSDVDFLLEVFKIFRITIKKILDVGCGTGGHLDVLSTHGINGLGVDLNEKMVDFATQRYPHLDFSVQNMKYLPYLDEFDAIICLCTTFCYNTSNEDIVNTLQSFRKALKNKGLLIIEVFNAISFMEKRIFQKQIEEYEGFGEFGLRSVSKHSIDENRQQMIEERNIYFEDDNLIESNITIFRLMFPQELRYFLETNGFSVLNFYGNYDTRHTNLDQDRLIVIAQKS